MSEISIGSIVYHKNYGEMVVSEIIEDLYFSAIEINKIDSVKKNETEEFFYKNSRIFRAESLGDIVFLNEEYTYPKQQQRVLSKIKLIRKNNKLTETKSIKRVNFKLKIKLTHITENANDIISRINMYPNNLEKEINM